VERTALGTSGGPTDAWWRSGVVYQIYPWSFQDSDGDGVGDLPGILRRLDHLNDGTERSLGIDAIWLSPFYRSPMVDFGYDVEDHRAVDPRFGTLEDFDALLEGCHARGLRVLIDFVPNHTSNRHPWFLESRRDRRSAKRDWYVWADPAPDGGPPNNWSSEFPLGDAPTPAWTFDRATGQYFLHSFLPQQPDLNWLNPEVREAMEDVLRFWLDRGVDGFRLDAVHRIGHDPELRDNVEGEPRRDQDLELTHEVLRGFRRVLDAHGAIAVGEVYLLDPERMIRYYGDGGDELHLAFNFWFLRERWSARAFADAARRFESLLPPGAWPDYTLSNHDHPRAITRYDERGLGPARARVAAMMLLTLRGTPFLYYGEEIGMPDVPIPRERWRDPVGRDPCRTPMRWEPGPRGGFTTGEPWLPVGDAAGVDVRSQDGDPRSMLSLYRRLLWYRRGSSALRLGDVAFLDTGEDVFAFERRARDARLLVALNFSERAAEVSLDGAPAAGALEISTDPGRAPSSVGLRPLELGPLEGVIVRIQGVEDGR